MDEPNRCASCDIELRDRSLVIEGSAYCCPGCAGGGPCVCEYEDAALRHPHNGHASFTELDVYGDA